MDSVKQLAERYGFNYISRDNKPYMCKAGNLRYAFARTSGVFFAIFDADFCPRSDFLGSLLPYMMQHHDVAIVQSPQFFRQLANQTWAEQGGGGTLERYYRVTQVNHDHWGAPGCVGSNAIYRRAALHATGGVVEIGYSEDIHTGFYALSHGWRVKYVPLALACGISPDTPKAYFKQQMRWCTGSLLLLTDLNFWKSNPTLIQKFCYLRGMMSYFVALLELVFGPFHQSLLVWLAPDSVPGYNIIYAIPSLVMSVIYILVVYRTWSGQRYNLNINCVSVIRQAGYMMAVKDYIFGTNVAWVPAGALQSKGDILDEVGRKDDGNHKYHHMRIFCAVWLFANITTLTIGIILRIIQNYPWYHFIVMLLTQTLYLFFACDFIFYSP
jgi:cellulose synthase/poly-beta-1,6-N-acetylglucosamine synthase-like glycosyltransferase